jgi:hypothetical protein
VRPHDVVLTPADDTAPSADARLPGEATVRLVTALGPKAWVELALGPHVIAADVGRETVKALNVAPGSRCAVHVRLPCFFPNAAAAPPAP